MSSRVAVYVLRGNGRSRRIGPMLASGASSAGDEPIIRMDNEFRDADTPVAAFYGYEKRLPAVMEAYRTAHKACVFIDLGYWGRRHGGRFRGFHKVSINARHPTEYFMETQKRSDRFRAFGIPIRPWTKGKHILVAGVSGRAAESIGLKPGAWERNAVRTLWRHTERPIVYRPKPSCQISRPIPGTHFSPPTQPLTDILHDCHAVVTRHSNVAVDALLCGVPVFCEDGVALPMAETDLSKIETPFYPDNRKKWAANVAYCQWNAEEMSNGSMWRFLKEEGLIP